ncbi:MAG: FtsX-like permease family protein [Pseudomonadales bacterium]|nr:FtsX-like permease family protein [Pseudomonadales bacterium]
MIESGSAIDIAPPPQRFFVLWMSLHYLQLKNLHYGSFIAWVSIAGLGLGVAVLITVLSVMNGFDEELSKRILGSVPHIVVLPESSETKSAGPDMLDLLAGLPGVKSAFEFFQAEGIVTRNGGVNAVAVYGVPFGQKLPLISENMTQGGLNNEAQSLVMGGPLAAYLGLQISDSVALILTAPTRYGVRPEIKRFTLTGLFEVGAELDYTVVVVRYKDIVHSGLEATGETGIRLVLEDPYAVEQIKSAVHNLNNWKIRDWTTQYGELFRAVVLEKRMMFLLLFLIVAVAVFNIVASQTMLVNGKRADIAIMRTMGATSQVILKIFLLQGVVISLLGIVCGVIIGIMLSIFIPDMITYLEGFFGIRMLEGTYFESLPSSLHITDLLVVAGVAFLLCVLSSLGPAWRAAQLNPTDSLG